MITDEMKKASLNAPYYVDNYCIEYKTINLSSIDKNIKLLDTLFREGINVSRIIDYEIDSNSKCDNIDFEKYQEGWVLSSNMHGNKIHDDITYIKEDDMSDVDLLAAYYESLRNYSKNIAMYASTSQDVINKFVSDYYTIYKSELMMEISVNNIRFDGEKFIFTNLYYSEGSKTKLVSFVRELLDLIIFQPPYILLDNDTIIDDIPREMYTSLSSNIKILLDKILYALSKLSISKTRIEKDVVSYLITKENLIRGGISQDDLLAKLSNKEGKKEYCC